MLLDAALVRLVGSLPLARPRNPPLPAAPRPASSDGCILGLAVLLDAALVRLVLLPVLLRLAGRAGWWSPAWLHKVLPDIKFSHD
ncbi:hypothetical protein [Streptomyces sp. NBC_00996]|uniref:hypothetical protein n=1 Tax=Streptomyces sp. NBC_00996 TaxID=2903710 RepID=UPI00386C4D14|nr:hypothetical protein OG390_38785 [Streptomyces sp. NBC_00996]